MTSKISPTGEDTNTLILSGDLTITRAVEIRSLLLETLEKGDKIGIALPDVFRVDLSFLQLMCAAQRTAAENGKRVFFETPIPTALQKLIRISGFEQIKGYRFTSKVNGISFDGGK